MINISVSYINAVADTVVFTWCHLATSPSKSGKKKKSVQSYTLFSELRYLSFELKWAVACFCFLTNIDCLPWCTSRSIRHDIRPARLFHPKFCLSISWRWHHLQLCPLGCGSVACQRLECFQQTSNPNNLFFTSPIIYVYICIYRYFLLMLSGEQKPMNKDILRFWCICIHFAPITSRCLCCRWSKGAIESSERLIIHCSMRHAAPKRHLPTSVSLQKLWEIAN